MKWSKKEQALIDILRPAYITRDDERGAPYAVFWKREPERNGDYYHNGGEIAGIDKPLFRGVKEGMCVKVEYGSDAG